MGTFSSLRQAGQMVLLSLQHNINSEQLLNITNTLISSMSGCAWNKQAAQVYARLQAAEI